MFALSGAAVTGRPMAAGVRVQRCRAQTQVAKALSAPAGYKTYESMMVLRPDLMEEERDAQLAKVESILAENGAIDIKLVTKGIQRIAYPIDGMWEGFMVFMTYMTPPSGIRAFENRLSNPDADSQGKIMRWNILRM